MAEESKNRGRPLLREPERSGAWNVTGRRDRLREGKGTVKVQ